MTQKTLLKERPESKDKGTSETMPGYNSERTVT